MLNDPQKNKVLEIWDAYITNGKRFINASKEFTQEELDKKREDIILVAKKSPFTRFTAFLIWVFAFFRSL